MSDVWLKVKLPVELHEKFRRWTFNNDTSMQETVVKLLNDWVGGVRGAPESKGICAYELSREHKAENVVPVVKTSHLTVSEPVKTTVEPKPKPDQKTCKHKYVSYMGRPCVLCGFVPPL